ncbi:MULTISPECIES: phosphopantothenoylcysteine decarboxylase [unclassified Streptococcus]|uniref:phosphopantothenoylcysteine decarboxylase n=1 Tax=unclassified Streptococcus TaxID=2608887 RepID=UPI001072DA31|nr:MULTISPECIES: phosphopantothenoylcysteine decarboxylase [unclassified Streptococcus]MBF0805194.1 phosphopantothenoylcysteine decarboxylase [Streptococcus sp. 19428wA2_WM07]TFU29233.1 phosphopantothenoylcysteine decarboxylase [Streptococcus sp. WM07]
MATITLAVTGSISAYKAADLVSQFGKNGHQVHVLMTESAQAFITPLTLQVLSKNRVHLDTMDEPDPTKVNHIQLAKETDLFLVAPASANTLAKLAHGLADNIVTATALALPPATPKLLAPAMNTNMYLHPATQKNIARLHDYGYQIVSPRESLLACGDQGVGALAEIPTILKRVKEVLDLA